VWGATEISLWFPVGSACCQHRSTQFRAVLPVLPLPEWTCHSSLVVSTRWFSCDRESSWNSVEFRCVGGQLVPNVNEHLLRFRGLTLPSRASSNRTFNRRGSVTPRTLPGSQAFRLVNVCTTKVTVYSTEHWGYLDPAPLSAPPKFAPRQRDCERDTLARQAEASVWSCLQSRSELLTPRPGTSWWLSRSVKLSV